MKHTVKSLRHMLCTTCGLCFALAVVASLLIFSVTNRVGMENRLPNTEKGRQILEHQDTSVTEITVNPPKEKKVKEFVKLQKAYKVCKEIVKKEETNHHTTKNDTMEDSTLSTTSTTSSVEDESTTVTTTVASQTMPTTAANSEPETEETESISNHMLPFNYNDVSSVGDRLSTLEDFVNNLHPEKISWDLSEYDDNGCVKITLDSAHGSSVLYVKPSGSIPSESEKSGSVSGDQIDSWQWWKDNQTSGCNISSVTWLDNELGIAPVRDIGIGSTLAHLTDRYLCVNGGATTLYRASDVITDQNKLNAILSAENLYTFVGGRVYSIGSYLDKYYHGKEHTFRFEDCDYVVQYGCNSIMEHNYTTGSWIIEYAVKEDIVTGISFMNKSYYKNEQRIAVSTNTPSSGSEPDAVTTAPSEKEPSSEAEFDDNWIEDEESQEESGEESQAVLEESDVFDNADDLSEAS